MTTAFTIHPVDAVFRRESTGLNPFGTRRDWAMLGVALAILAAGLTAIGYRFGYNLQHAAATTGAIAGMLPPILMCRPVRGVVPESARSGLLAQLADAGFVPVAAAMDEERFVHKAPRWMRWDSNSAVLRRRRDGDFDATIPLYVYKRLKYRTRGSSRTGPRSSGPAG